LFIIDHNFSTRNPSKSIKVSKDSDFSLAFDKNLSEILPSSSLGLGPDEVGQKGLKQLHLRDYSQKIWNPKPKFFFIADAKACQIFSGFEQLSSAIVGRDIPVQKHVQTAGF